jgi:hypothetical protein
MSLNVEIPDALKQKVHAKLEQSGALDTIDHRIKQGMCAAIEYLRGDKSPKKPFAGLGFQKDEREVKALQVIYKYLASVGLTWSLETIQQETNVKADDTEIPALIDVLTGTASKGEELDADEEEQSPEEEDEEE